MNVRKLTFYLLAVLLGGCLPVISLHPLYTDEDIAFQENLLGVWVDDPNAPETTMEFSRSDKEKNEYKLILTDKGGEKGLFTVYLIKLKDKLFLDAYPRELPWEQDDPNEVVRWPLNSICLIPVHMFIKIDSIEPQLKMRIINNSSLKELLKKDPDVIKHTLIGDRILVTASTKELQAFVLKYADDNEVFSDEIVLNRKAGKNP
jgi:hypothetical protein